LAGLPGGNGLSLRIEVSAVDSDKTAECGVDPIPFIVDIGLNAILFLQMVLREFHRRNSF